MKGRKEYMAQVIELLESECDHLRSEMAGLREEIREKMGECTQLEQLNAVYIKKLQQIKGGIND